MLGSGGDEVDAGGFDAAVAQYIGQFRHIPADLVKRPGEQVAQVVGEHFGGRDPRLFTDGLHLCPDLFPAQPFSVSGEKDFTGDGFVFPSVFQQFPSQFARDEDGADLALQGDFRPAALCGLHGEIL